MARSSGSFTSETVRLSARKFWDTYTPEQITTYKIRHTPMPNRWNKKPLFLLGLHSNQRNIPKFITKIGSRIKRKQNNIRIWKKIWL